MKLRLAGYADTERLIELGRKMHFESWYRDFDYDAEKVRTFIGMTLESPSYLGLVLEHEDEAVGFFWAAETEHFFGRDKYACDIVFYIEPEHRGGMAATRMIRAFEAWCRIRRVKEIHIGTSTGIATERTVRFFTKMGFHSPAMGFRKKCVWAD